MHVRALGRPPGAWRTPAAASGTLLKPRREAGGGGKGCGAGRGARRAARPSTRAPQAVEAAAGQGSLLYQCMVARAGFSS